MWCTFRCKPQGTYVTIGSLDNVCSDVLVPGVQVDGQAHVVHSEEEPQGTRVTIDSLTCLLANEADPSRLLAASPGKLVRYLVEDGSQVQPDQAYAEVEVRVSVGTGFARTAPTSALAVAKAPAEVSEELHCRVLPTLLCRP